MTWSYLELPSVCRRNPVQAPSPVHELVVHLLQQPSKAAPTETARVGRIVSTLATGGGSIDFNRWFLDEDLFSSHPQSGFASWTENHHDGVWL
jgi:hypothetical protein